MRFIILIIFLVCMPNFLVAQGTNTDSQNTKTTSTSSASKASPILVAESTSTSKAEADKEARLESLRYKHLWIAYSLVWLIIFVFMRSTWQRGQQVENRLEELKSRLIALEEQKK